MFNITDFSIRRTAGQAVVFYILWFIGILVASFILSILLSPIVPNNANSMGFSNGVLMGALLACIICTWLAYAISRKKGTAMSGSDIGLIIATAVLGLVGGGLLGLIIPAYLTTRFSSTIADSMQSPPPTA